MSAAELEALATKAENADAGQAAAAEAEEAKQARPPGAPEAPEPPDNMGAICFLLAGFREVASAILKVESLRRTLADDNIEKIGRALVPVADKHGIQLGSMMGGLEVMAVMVAGPILWTAWRELDAELKAKRARPVEAEEAQQAGLDSG